MRWFCVIGLILVWDMFVLMIKVVFNGFVFFLIIWWIVVVVLILG